MVDKNQQSFQEYKNENYNKQLNDELMNLITNIPESNGSRYFKKIDKNIGIIADEFMYDYYKDCANFIYINFFEREEIIRNEKIDVFLYVTAWRGLQNNDWRGKEKKESLYEVIDYFKSKGIPTIFQSKEDPSNYHIFIDIAQKCDYIFTTDINKIDDYKKECNNDNVYLCTFAINPLLHNPVGIKSNEKLKKVLFAGSWMRKYPHRGEDMKKIFDGVLNSGISLDIIDRNFYINSKSYFYPEKYIPYTSPPINHSDLQKVQKLYNWIINLNSIKYSPTMCAVRCYEAQASGNCIISNYSMAVNNFSPNIFCIYDESEVKYILNEFNDDEMYRHQMYGVRNVMNERCAYDKISYILQIVDSNFHNKNNEKKILVVADKINHNICEMFDNQVFEYKYLVDKNKAKEIYEDYDFITFFTENYFYGEYYLQDMINGFKYTDSDYITKDGYYNGDEVINGVEHDYVNIMKDKYKSMFDTKSFTFNFLNSLYQEANMDNGYSIDHFELNIKNNISKFPKIKKTYNKIKSIFNEKQNKEEYKISIIVEVYNNGEYLLNKCFNSLKRSSMFKDMEIIIVDYYSDDKDTIAILNILNREYSNVKLYKYKQEENVNNYKFINLANGEYITFLNPYNEATNDGYAKLYKEINNSNYDICMGSILKVNEEEELIKFDTYTVIEEIEKINNAQCMLIKKDFLLNNNLSNNDIFLNKLKIIDEIICICYK